MSEIPTYPDECEHRAPSPSDCVYCLRDSLAQSERDRAAAEATVECQVLQTRSLVDQVVSAKTERDEARGIVRELVTAVIAGLDPWAVAHAPPDSLIGRAKRIGGGT